MTSQLTFRETLKLCPRAQSLWAIEQALRPELAVPRALVIKNSSIANISEGEVSENSV